MHNHRECEEDVMEVTALTSNFRTRDLIETCVTRFREFYPDLALIVVDDDSRDESTEYVEALGELPNTEAVLLDENIGHGPEWNKGIERVQTPYVFTMDSDVFLHSPGMLEAMYEEHQANPSLFAIGNKVPLFKNKSAWYIWPLSMMMDVEKYRLLNAPFIKHGAIAKNTMVAAARAGYDLVDFPIFDYVESEGSGTRKALRRQIQAGVATWENSQHWHASLLAKLKDEFKRAAKKRGEAVQW